MKLQIDFNLPPRPIAHHWPSFFMMGSCFASEQANRMKELQMNVYSNPFGIIYNPISIQTLLERMSTKRLYTNDDFIQKDSFFSWEHHGDFKYSSRASAIEKSNHILTESFNQLKNSDVVVITLGTSLVYRYNDTTVANCHKIANKEFVQEQLSSKEVNCSLNAIISSIQKVNPRAEIIFTVSPIRHLRSGVIQSARSKAVLISQLHEVLDELNDGKLSYFPAYEIFVDELRDYRFAKEDLTHPTSMATAYIWERFVDTYFNTPCKQTLKDLEKLAQLKRHRPTDEKLHRQAITKLKQTLINNYPHITIK